jgi:hypothetical protein
MTNDNISASGPQKPAANPSPAPANPQQQTQANPPKPADKPGEQQK